ncbi:MAG: Asp23/Gls24 family envelope stress response protein [Atopobiaceae bacterium]|jgi:uncharacterized alkaline shock family protein YloU|nr:Asp23/Gls24 family envelope stress response protein [Atopobiaceae bacterium]MCH3943963.1 Asp23/Gls24 family envelope stress response protein [Atopobiaceae bacterium]MCH3944135.1 Asp23/Gls24 family envelope stress response protein [Atopobiaceae bacterium]
MSSPIAGTLKVSNDCIADLAGYAALECYGVVGMAFTDSASGITRILPMRRLRKGIDVEAGEQGIEVDLHVVVEQGVNLASVSENLISAVRFTLREIAEIDDASVSVHIDGMRVR